MDSAILGKLEEKIAESESHETMLKRLAAIILEDSLHGKRSQPGPGGREESYSTVLTCITAGRLYNTFYYQTRRVLHRDPTPGEFEEFLAFVNKNVASGSG